MNCPFCSPPAGRVIARNDLAIAMLDAYPVSLGHTLIVPQRHIRSFFKVTEAERLAMMALLDSVKGQIDDEFRPDAYNIGINDGPAAGQTVPHVHIHLIPRYGGDCPDPRGGVRWIFQDKADYWSPREGEAGA